MPLTEGTKFDRYHLVSLIGSGGMGEIYLATDTRLGRKVALKLLPEQYTQDIDRVRRFEQEALAASALNHPNIITIYETGEANGRHFIATEFIEGHTLRRRILGGRLSQAEAIDIATQVVSALAAAHAAGIVHRDIKPENIMIRPDGYVKVLDFGLAKLTEETNHTGVLGFDINTSESIDAPTTADLAGGEADVEKETTFDNYATMDVANQAHTVPGVIMGTAQYMSPEQARGERIDARTDIFSIGIVLYEMLTSRPPFSGTTAREIISNILNYEPLQPSSLDPSISDVVEWIVGKAMVKERDERYQTAREMLNDLKRIQVRMDVEHEMSRSPMPNTERWWLRRGQGAFSRHFKSSGRISGFLDNQISAIVRSKFSGSIAMAMGLALLIAVAFGGFGAYKFMESLRESSIPFQRIQFKRMTATGRALRAAISPDGKYVVFAQNEAGRQSLQVRQITTSNIIPIVPPAEVIYRGLSFSNDGSHVYYVVQEQNNPIQNLYQVPVLGGVSRRILTDIDSPVAVSPQGDRLAFVRRYRGKGEDALILAGEDGSGEKVLAKRKGPDFFGISGVSWSPDGRSIACPAGTNKGGRRMYVAQINAADGKETILAPREWVSVGRISWMRNGRGMIVSAVDQGSTLAQIQYISLPRLEVRRITNDLNDYRDMSLTIDSTALVTVQSEAHVNVWVQSAADLTAGTRITDGVGQYNGVRGLTWTPNGQIVYVSRASGSQDIWTMDRDGGSPLQLTTAETRADIYPAVSPDGRYIVYVSTRTGNSNIYRMDLANGSEIQLTTGTSEEFPVVSADSRWVIYTATSSTNFTLWKVPIDGGRPVQLTSRLSQWPAVSPDGRHIVCWYRPKPDSRWQLAVIPIDGGEPEKIIEMPVNAESSIPTRWMPDGSGISYVSTSNGVSNIWLQPLDGSAPRQLTGYTSDQIFWFDWSWDGNHLACSRGSVTNDIVLITGNN